MRNRGLCRAVERSGCLLKMALRKISSHPPGIFCLPRLSSWHAGRSPVFTLQAGGGLRNSEQRSVMTDSGFNWISPVLLLRWEQRGQWQLQGGVWRPGRGPLLFLPLTSFSPAFPWSLGSSQLFSLLSLEPPREDYTWVDWAICSKWDTLPQASKWPPLSPSSDITFSLRPFPEHTDWNCSSFKPGPSSRFTVSICLLHWSSGPLDTYLIVVVRLSIHPEQALHDERRGLFTAVSLTPASVSGTQSGAPWKSDMSPPGSAVS